MNVYFEAELVFLSACPILTNKVHYCSPWMRSGTFQGETSNVLDGSGSRGAPSLEEMSTSSKREGVLSDHEGDWFENCIRNNPHN